MVNWFDYIIFFPSKYYIIPSILAAAVFLAQWYEGGNKNFLFLVIQIFGIFSFTTSAEYIFIFLITESLPESLATLDKILLGIGVLITFLVIFRYATEGTRIGAWTSNVLNKYFLPKAIPVSISPFNEQLIKLQEIRENLMTGNKLQVNKTYLAFFEIGSSILVVLQRIYSKNWENLEIIQTAYNCCKKDFMDMSDGQQLDDEKRTKIAVSISEFIGILDGFTKKV